MILLDNLLQCLLFITMIDLSRTCDSTVSLICYALVIFTIYFWIKIKLKVLIYLTNPTLRVQQVLVETSPVKPKTGKARQSKRLGKNGLCLEVTERVQHDDCGKMKEGDHLAYSSFGQPREGDDYECSQE
jgi:hypothetical protein